MEDWVFKGTKLMINTKKQRLKIQSRGWIFKNTILKKRRRKKGKKKSQELLKTTTTTTTKNIYMVFALKIGSFFFEK